ncbi:neprilysin-4 isoform X2 [Anthonomus grandis grandis]|uniref:neprilysin-4 isoform X2 n=1 Tax=Anthonomus grandis grandis TaxID=2921223 RepID=UPI002165ADF6|nr:neprilysin-4 isoform X2 [Anthonomus grandis grandis]XP_050308089.1 neprilysin-4 isoform X2 [Anthonomus grandis grandis]
MLLPVKPIQMQTFFILLLLRHSTGFYIKTYDQFDKTEILDHEDHRDILRDSKTVFLPEMAIYFKNPQIRQKRKINCQIFGPKSELCYKILINQDAIDTSDYVVMGNDSFLNDTTPSTTLLPIRPDIKQENDTNENDIEADKTILVVNVNITNPEKPVLNGTFENDYCSGNDEHELYWNSHLNKQEVRELQSRIMRKYMNNKINPCNDFYGYACGNWKKYFKIPPDRSSFDTFEIIRENLDHVLKEILEDRSEVPAISTNNAEPISLDYLFHSGVVPNNTMEASVKAKLFYASCMDEATILKKSSRPLLSVIELLGGWPMLSQNWTERRYDLFRLLARLRLINNDLLISQWIGPDMKNANQYIVHVDQTTLGLPTREYFTDPKNIKYVSAYKTLIMGTVQLLGAELVDIENDVNDLIDFETKLADIMATTEERRNVSDFYLKTDLSSMTLFFPQYEWKTYFDIILGPNISLRTPVAVYCVKYLLDLVPLLSTTSHRTIQNYLIWRFVRHRLNNLDSRFLEIKQRFNFVLFGREKQPQRWQFCVSQVNTHMGMAIGSLFVQRYFDESSKDDTIRMTQDLMASFKDILKESTWLDPHTKEYARMKIDKMDLKIGFPDFALNKTELAARYYDVNIQEETFFENVLSILRHLSRAEQKRLGSEVNRTLWSTSPAVVNAYYSRNKNQIMFPAGILQPPFYHKHFPKALNFGGIGVVIGHEITHGFDDKGRLFDAQGNLMMWWRVTSIRNFYDKAQCMIDQYSQYMLPQIKAPIDGYMTQGENIADNGGIKESFRAYKTWLKNNPKADEILPGMNLTGKQLFFLNFAQVWCGQQKVEEAKNRMKTSVHSPGIFRIIGVLSNSKDFSREFNCPKNSPMNPDKKCTIW